MRDEKKSVFLVEHIIGNCVEGYKNFDQGKYRTP